jgi:hypothetical protein
VNAVSVLRVGIVATAVRIVEIVVSVVSVASALSVVNVASIVLVLNRNNPRRIRSPRTLLIPSTTWTSK